ncbi:MAG: hypothetical protein KGZ37_03660 [Nitrosarchaeum sp.]|nr:hypothetical protein [Nitrosarchaeum sp.]
MRYRRGLSTVVGAVFFIIATTTVVTYITYSMNSIDNFSQSVIVSESQNIDRGRESITISQVGIVNNKFNMTVTNTGSLPVKLTRLWVTNQDGVTSDQKADLNIQLNPGQQQYNIGQSTAITAESTASYNLKVVTERGNISTFQVSPNTSTRIQLITPGTVAPNTDFKIISLITNNSTTPNNIANLTPTMLSNVTLTLVDGPNPANIDALPQGSTAAFTWTYTAPVTSGGISMNASYTGAPTGKFVLSNFTNQLSAEAAAATQSQWSQAASRVGILISGIPNPIHSLTNSLEYAKWGIGIINPLDRDVEVYAAGVLFTNPNILNTVVGVEPGSGIGLWSKRALGAGANMAVWEGGSTPVIIPAKSVGQFRFETDFSSNTLYESIVTMQALTSEGKLTVQYVISSDSAANYPLINAFYSTNAASPTTSWTYNLNNIPGNTNDKLFNMTVQNAGADFPSKIKVLILVPSDFTDVQDYTAGSGGWGVASIFTNPDGSRIIKVETTASTFLGGTSKTYQFTADTPSVTSDKLYVFQTTTIYPSFTGTGQSELASALSEAGVEIVP